MRKRCVTELTRKAEKFEIPFQKIWWLPGYKEKRIALRSLYQVFSENIDYKPWHSEVLRLSGKMQDTETGKFQEQNILLTKTCYLAIFSVFEFFFLTHHYSPAVMRETLCLYSLDACFTAVLAMEPLFLDCF